MTNATTGLSDQEISLLLLSASAAQRALAGCTPNQMKQVWRNLTEAAKCVSSRAELDEMVASIKQRVGHLPPSHGRASKAVHFMAQFVNEGFTECEGGSDGALLALKTAFAGVPRVTRARPSAPDLLAFVASLGDRTVEEDRKLAHDTSDE
jgi:hypothetical protein